MDWTRTNFCGLCNLLDSKTSVIQNHTLDSINFFISGYLFFNFLFFILFYFILFYFSGGWTTWSRAVVCLVLTTLEFSRSLLSTCIGSVVLSKYLYAVRMDFREYLPFFCRYFMTVHFSISSIFRFVVHLLH